MDLKKHRKLSAKNQKRSLKITTKCIKANEKLQKHITEVGSEIQIDNNAIMANQALIESNQKAFGRSV